MSKSKYSYYHLYPTPTFNNTIIIPPKPFLAMDENRFLYMEQQCNMFKEYYYCKETAFAFSSGQHDDCIHQLILKHDIIATCSYTTVNMPPEVWQKLDDRHYILSCTTPTKIWLVCAEESHNSIQGTFLVDLPEGCTISTQRNTVKNIQNKLQGNHSHHHRLVPDCNLNRHKVSPSSRNHKEVASVWRGRCYGNVVCVMEM